MKTTAEQYPISRERVRVLLDAKKDPNKFYIVLHSSICDGPPYPEVLRTLVLGLAALGWVPLYFSKSYPCVDETRCHLSLEFNREDNIADAIVNHNDQTPEERDLEIELEEQALKAISRG